MHRPSHSPAAAPSSVRRRSRPHCPKYLYLMFAACPRFDYRTGLLSTEGKVLRGAVRPG